MNIGGTLLFGLLAAAAPAAYAQTTAPVAPPPTAPGQETDPVEAVVGVEAEAEAEDVEAEADTADAELEAVVVTAERQRGAVLGDIPPEVVLNRQEIRALGAGTLTELLEALGPQIRSGRGRGDGPPVVLLNGRRISGFGEIRGIPPEAIERVDILPEEVALRYGYRADQRVVNFVLRERFRAVTVEASAGGSTRGGRVNGELEGNVLRLNRQGRSSLDVEINRSTALLESERDLTQSAPASPFSLAGGLTAPVRGAEIDPALSALAGALVTTAGVPASAANGAPALAEFAGLAPEVTDLSAFRTLQPETESLTLNGTINRVVGDDVSATLNARLDVSSSESLLGLPAAVLTVPAASPFSPFAEDVLLYRYLDEGGPLRRESESVTGHLGAAANGQLGDDWRWAFTGNYDVTESRSDTERDAELGEVQARLNAGEPGLNPFGTLPRLGRRTDQARSTNQIANAQLVVNGTLRELPAGPLSATVRADVEARALDSESVRSGVETSADLSRQSGGLQASVDLPIASRRREALTGLGDLSVNANFEINELSDFGTLTTLGYGLTWSPIRKLNLIASVTEEDGAPGIQQLGDPVVATPNVPVFDFTRRETVDVTRIDGGNPDLVADSRRVMKLGLTLRPFEERDLSFTANYTRSEIRDLIATFPTATPEIEAAFPDRFVRDADGRLVQIDSRPVNFERADREELRTGINFSKPLTNANAPGAAAGARGGAAEGRPRASRQGAGERPGGGGRGGFGGGGRGFGGRGGGGRLQLALYHTLRLQDEILIREGVPVLDLLDGSATGSNGGQSRHEVEAQAGLFRNGLGARLDARYRSGTTVRGDAQGATNSAGDLEFSGLTTVNLRLFADLTQRRELIQRRPWLRGTRVSLALTNLFDQRLDVRDASGAVPVSYQPDRLDPVGRSLRVSVRKLFLPRRPPGARRRDRQAGG